MLKTYVRKSLIIIIALNYIPLYAHAHAKSIEIRAGAFLPTECLVKEIYGGAFPDIGAELTFNSEASCWGGWVNADVAVKRGCSLGVEKFTQILLVNLSLGARVFLGSCSKIRPALGAGLNIGFARLENCNSCSPCSPQVFSKTSPGFVIKSNLYWDLPDCRFLDFFADYRFQQIKCAGDLNVGGFVIGVGYGTNF